ncbi:histidine--tRNA ligase [Roseiarcus sp.]|uniref:histidine--tRNA ligase n=1 Tax=Roseiarcus sp. TaxID=1969460 RepID=UPI003F96347D
MTESSVPTRVRATLPRGLVDRAPADIAAADAMMAKIRSVYALYGFEAVETPFIEYTEALGKFLPDQDRPNEGVFSFKDDDEQWLSLRYDLTAPLARYVAENFDKLAKPYRSYRAGWVFRNEKPGPGRYRQFMQFDADTVGAASVAADAEICMMAADCLEALGIKRGDYVVKVNNRKVLDGVMEAIGLGGANNAGRRLTVLRAMDKYDRLGADGVRALLGRGRKDESGDFTKGADLGEQQIEPLLQLLNFGTTFDLIQRQEFDSVDVSFPNPFLTPPSEWNPDAYGDPERMRRKAQALQVVNPQNRRYDWSFGFEILGELSLLFEMNQTLAAGIRELAEIEATFQATGFTATLGAEDFVERVRIDPSVVRGLEYYTGPVFEAELTFEVKDEAGRPVRFGSVGGGGRYDGLVARFREEPVPATGFSVGVSRLLAALRAIDSPIVAAAKADGPVVVLALDRDEKSMANTQRLVAALRGAGIAAEMYLGSAGMNAQLKYADKRKSRVAVIQGSNERDAPGGPQVAIRDLKLGAELAKSTKDRADYLELRQRAQFTAPEAELVERVREVLARP